MMAADSLHANVHGLVLSGVSSLCHRACNANAFAWHFALHLGLHSAPSSGAPITALLAADSLGIAVQPIMLSGGSFRLHGSRRCAWRACASAQPSVPPSNVQMSCLEHGRPVAVAVFAGALAAGAAAPPGRDCRERMREANAEGKTKGCGTQPPAKLVCTWGWRGTVRLRRRAAWGVRPAPIRACPRASHDRTRHDFPGRQP
jgi:hypothetical protein